MIFAAPRRAALFAAAAAVLVPAATAPVALLAQDQTQAQTETETDAAETASEAPEPRADLVVATVDGMEITLGEVIMARASLPQQYQQIPDAQLMPALIDQAVVQALLAKKAEAEGKADDPLVQLQIAAARKSALSEAVMADVIAEATTDDKVRAAYDAQIEDFEPAQEIRASHILVKEKEAADALKAELDGGADFAELATEHGTDGTKDRGGDLGWFEREQMVPAFADAAFEAEEGVVVGPVETQFGWHLILKTGEREAEAPSFEEMREEIARGLASQAAQDAVAAVREGSDVQISETLPEASAIRRDDLLAPQ